MTNKERLALVFQRQMDLFNFVKGWSGGKVILSNEKIMELLPVYNNGKMLQRDLDTLEQKFLIARSYKWISSTSSFRTIKVVNHTKELLSQCNYDYLEALALANPHCFLIKWRDGYEYHQGGVHKYAEYKMMHRGATIGRIWYGTGMWLLKEPSILLSRIPLNYKIAYKAEDQMGEDRDEPIPF